ncbi:putative tonB-dependent receptor [Fibrella aestuarina BUZ 2]|uniref:Putative tonB-dependent receptor n=1 Tax=Fibrella aestuarina BUZ 2 TaxID=1166018 RepID=I0K4F0_9BACT|nr:TonB-dependent receptor [Fibrella aestuarina]CCG99003.1 putative tonB-dependent receptor [Fibrella aestuarina BUZ 2]
MKLLLLLVAFIGLPVSICSAQNTLTGKVTHGERVGEAVIGAAIYLPDLRLGATTDVNGSYRLTNLPAGTFTVQVSYISHKTLVQTVTIQGETAKDFVMENSSQMLEEVIVSGAATKTIIRESPVPITALSQLRMLQQSSTNLIDAVAKLPGMSQVTTGAGLSKPIIRGLGFNRVITMHDGIRQEDNQWGEEHSIQLDEYAIDRYEIIRGAGSLMYGSDGLGGVVTALSARPVEEGKVRGRLLTNYQTNHNLLGASVQAAGNQNGFVWQGVVSTKSSANYRNRADGRVFASNYADVIDISGFIGLNKKWGYSRLYFLRTDQRFNIINGTRDSLTGRFTTTSVRVDGTQADRPVTDSELNSRDFLPYNSQHLINGKVSLNNLFQFRNGGALTLNLSHARNSRDEFADIVRPNQAQLGLRLFTNYVDLRYNLPTRHNWEITLGSNGMQQALDNQGYQALYPNYDLFDLGGFVFFKKNIDKLKISGGVRYDGRSLRIGALYADADGAFQVRSQGPGSQRFAGADKSYSNVSASLGAVYSLTDRLNIRANVSRGFRAPTVPELSSNGVHAGTFRYEIGKLDAVPEVAYQGDLGFTYESPNWYVDFSLFQNSIQNYVYSERVQTTAGIDSLFQGNVPVYRYAQGNARLQGMEGTVTFNPAAARWFSLTQTYSAVFGRNLSAVAENAQYLPFMPAPRWVSQLRLTRDRIKSRFRNLYATLDVEVTQRQDRFLAAYNTETATPGYTLVHVGAGADVTGNQKQTLFSVFLSANNLFDVIYQAHQSRLKYLDVNNATGRVGVFNMGRNVSLKVVVPF